jgi:hypothetical protein
VDDERSRTHRASRVATEATIEASHHAIERARLLRVDAERAIEASQRIRERIRQETLERPRR